MVQIAYGWELDVDRGPDWLFVRPHRPPGGAEQMPPLAEQVWALMEQNFIHSLVPELDQIDFLSTYLIGQLVWLQKRIHTHDGLMRIAGLCHMGQEVLHQCRLDSRLPCFSSREEAVMGCQPRKPR